MDPDPIHEAILTLSHAFGSFRDKVEGRLDRQADTLSSGLSGHMEQFRSLEARVTGLISSTNAKVQKLSSVCNPDAASSSTSRSSPLSKVKSPKKARAFQHFVDTYEERGWGDGAKDLKNLLVSKMELALFEDLIFQ